MKLRLATVVAIAILTASLSIVALTACSGANSGEAGGNAGGDASGDASAPISASADSGNEGSDVNVFPYGPVVVVDGYSQIDAETAKAIMDEESDYLILDVRTQEEYDERHIPGAILLPNTEIKLRAEDVLPNRNQLILVYCRSGNRSKMAAADLAKLGYTNVFEFGGIKDWPYETE